MYLRHQVNIYWVYGIILVILCAIQFFPFVGTVKDITNLISSGWIV